MSTSTGAPASALVPTYATYPFELSRGQGMYVRDPQGREYLDFYGGHAVASLGHSPAEVLDAVAAQASELLFYSNVARVPVREQAARALVEFAGPTFSQVFFCNSGTEANEAALKTALALTGRGKIAALTGAFHGRTLLSLSATDGKGYRGALEPLLVPCVRLRPNVGEDLARVDDSVAAVIVEPIQSMAGVVALGKAYLEALRQRTREVGAALIFDEVQTGMGRLGAPFAASRHRAHPDMITTAKGLGGGVPVGAVIFDAATAVQVRQGDLGSTFGGGPLACAAALATVRALVGRNIPGQVARVSAVARAALKVGPVTEVRGEGWLLGLVTAPPAKEVYEHLLSRRILTGTSADPHVLRLLPPLVAEEEHVEILRQALEDWPGEGA